MTHQIHTLTSPPSLPRLYARAVTTGRGRKGGVDASVTPASYELIEQPIDADHLAEYQRVCGFRVSDVLPATYLHVMAFPLSVARMVDADFPFPLVGLIHVRNVISQLRPVLLSESVALTVHASDVRPHPAGTQVDLVAEAYASDGLVWTGRSTYLRRGPSGEKRPSTEPAPGPGSIELDRTEAGPAGSAPIAKIRVPGDIGRRYGSVGGDINPIHLHTLTAKAFGFPRAIAHGMWLKARVLASLEGRLPAAYTVDVSFKTPVLLPSTVLLSTPHVDTGWEVDVRSSKGKPHLIGSVRS